jgi:hypothetical protein
MVKEEGKNRTISVNLKVAAESIADFNAQSITDQHIENNLIPPAFGEVRQHMGEGDLGEKRSAAPHINQDDDRLRPIPR